MSGIIKRGVVVPRKRVRKIPPNAQFSGSSTVEGANQNKEFSVNSDDIKRIHAGIKGFEDRMNRDHAFDPNAKRMIFI